MSSIIVRLYSGDQKVAVGYSGREVAHNYMHTVLPTSAYHDLVLGKSLSRSFLQSLCPPDQTLEGFFWMLPKTEAAWDRVVFE